MYILLFISFIIILCNLNGCNFGSNSMLKESEETHESNIQIDEPLLWYALSDVSYLLIKITSTNSKSSLIDNDLLYINYCIDVLFYYPYEEKDISTISEIYIESSDSDLIFDNEILFIELSTITKLDKKVYYGIKKSNGYLNLLPLINEKLIITEQFINTDMFNFIKLYNDEVLNYQKAINNGNSYYMEFENKIFYNNMTINEIMEFFDSVVKAKSNYTDLLCNLHMK